MHTVQLVSRHTRSGMRRIQVCCVHPYNLKHHKLMKHAVH
jgi:hypothetical protein